MSTKTSIGRLRVEQRLWNSGDPFATNYDLVIAVVSWESRNSTSLKAIGGTSAQALLLRFKSTKPSIENEKNNSEAELRSLCANHTLLTLEKSTEFDVNSAAIEEAIRDKFLDNGRPLSILIDITCIPKSYLTFLYGLCFTHEYACRIDALYAEGQYDLNSSSGIGGPLSIISEGEWKSLQVPYLEADETFPVERDLLVVLGGEIGFSLPFIERFEPRRLSVVFIKNGLDPATLGGSEKAAYAELTSEPLLDRVDLPINDLIGVLQHAHGFCFGEEGSVVGLAIGSKPQSLGLALAALDIANLEVVCRVPSSYAGKDVKPSGRVFFYKIEDRFEPMSYLA